MTQHPEMPAPRTSSLNAVRLRYAPAACVVLVALNILLFSVWLWMNHNSPRQDNGRYPELQELQQKGALPDPFTFFRDLARKKGGRYAFEILKRAPIPPGTDMHLLGHTVGDELYKQEGAEGIQICTQDFRNACSHSIVVGLFQDKREAALDEISEACRRAPGGKGAYTMCFHGLGHGILAAVGYDLAKAVSICQKTSKTQQDSWSESSQCISGTVMEIVGGGFHNRGLWEKQRKKYLSRAQPLLPCANELIPPDARPLCYSYLTPHLLESSGADLGKPAPQDFERAFLLCDDIPRRETLNRHECYGGFGKEFVVLVKDRDIRTVADMSDVQLSTIYQWCLLGKHREGIDACLFSTLQSLYWGGENDRNTSIQFCRLMPNINQSTICFTHLMGSVAFYINDESYRAAFCQELPDQYRPDCRARLLPQ